MSDPYLSEIRLMSFNFAPRGWAQCNGQLLPVQQNQALFSLLGTNYGGNGQTTFALPDLRGRVPIHVGAGFTVGQRAGAEFHTLGLAELPTHTHVASGTALSATTADPANNLLAQASAALGTPFGPASSPVAMATSAISAIGGNQPHENRQPFLTLNFCIALQGIFPSPT
jgi:microcystin-dependent protein